MNYLWALAERFSLRAVSSLLSITMAVLTSPETLGLYTTAITVVTLAQVLTDTSLRQAGSAAPWEYSKNDSVLLRVSRASGVAATALLACVLGVSAKTSLTPPEALSLLPLVFVPLATACSAPSIVRLQREGAFARIARMQAISSFTSLAITVPVLFATRDALAPALQFLVAEVGLVLLVRIGKRTRGDTVTGSTESTRSFVVRLCPISLVNGLAWGQSQLDRLCVAVFASATTAGLYALSLNIARVVPEVLIVAIGNVLRPALASEAAQGGDISRSHSAVRSAARSAGLGVSFSAVVSSCCAPPVLSRFLDLSWTSAIRALPIVAASTVPVGLVAITTVVLQARLQSGRAIAPLAVSATLAVPIGALAQIGVAVSAGALVVRELAVGVWRLLAVDRRTRLSLLGAYVRAVPIGLLGLIAGITFPVLGAGDVAFPVGLVLVLVLGGHVLLLMARRRRPAHQPTIGD